MEGVVMFLLLATGGERQLKNVDVLVCGDDST
jgi:hypothetical protein